MSRSHRRPNPVASRRAAQRRAAIAALALIALVSAVGMGVYAFGAPPPEEHLDSVTAAQRAFQQAQSDVNQVFAPGIDLVRDDQTKATKLLTEAYEQLQVAEQAGVPAGTIAPLRAQVVAGLDRIYKAVTVSSSLLFSFEKSIPKAEITTVVQGPDGAPYVLERTTKSVYRVDVKGKKATLVIKNGTTASGIKAADPKMLAVGGTDLLILDAKNVLFRWRPADAKGKGTLSRVQVNGSSGWGTDVRAIGTFVRSADEGLYNLYVVDPSERQILRYSPAADGSGYPASPTAFLATAQTVDDVDGLFIDGDIFVAEGGRLTRFLGLGGNSTGWQATDPGDTLLRPAPNYVDLTSPDGRQTGTLYAYDAPNARIVALDKASGAFREQYRTVLSPGWLDLRGMYMVTGASGRPPTVYWVDGKRLYGSVLQAIAAPPPVLPSSSPGASGSPRASAGAATPRASGGAASPRGSAADGSPAAP